MERQIGETAKKQKEEKYLVLKLDDIKKYLNREEKKDLELMCQTIDLGRRIAGKHENHYVVVNE